MTASTYTAPVDQLLTLGDPLQETQRRDYLALGLAAEHIPDLIRMVQDESLNEADSQSQEVWGPVHAWRALGQLRAEPAIEPLLGLLHRFDDNDDDWVSELRAVFGQIGPSAISPLEQYAASPKNQLYARSTAAGGLQEIGAQHPQAREAAVAALARLLEDYAQPGRDPALNGFVISYLTELKAVETAPLIQRAFEADAVEEDVIGDWEDVQIELGLKEKRTNERQIQPGSFLAAAQRLGEPVKLGPAKLSTSQPAAPKPGSHARKHHRRKK